MAVLKLTAIRTKLQMSLPAIHPQTDLSAPEAGADVVQITRAVGDELRANILRVLARDSFGVLELCEIFSMAQPAMSHHLKKLNEADLVGKRREGTSVFYQRANATHLPLLQAIFEALDRVPPDDEIQHGIHRVHAARVEQSRHFFASNADALAQQTALVCAPEVYADAVMQTVMAQDGLPRRSALEIGPGNAGLLQALAGQFESVTGIDNSAEMLAATAAATGDRDNIELIQGDFAILPAHPNYDLIVASMVVHHLPSPSGFFHHAAGLLNNHGLLVIAELCNHDQDWVKKMCGDVWQGFDPAALEQWAQQAGLKQVQQQFLAQRNGFRVQVVAFAHHNHLPSDN